MAVKNNEILIGSKENPILALDNDSIISINGNLACDLLCETIPIDTLEIQCRYDRMRVAFSPIDYNGMSTSSGKKVYARSDGTEDVFDIPYASGLWYYNGGSYIGKFYVVDAQRTGKTIYTIKAQSAIGILDGMPYYGKLFVNTALIDAVRNIILTDGMVDTSAPFLTELSSSIVFLPGLEEIHVTGWIPVCTKRQALHYILFSHGINILKSEDDSFLITRLSNASAGEIDPDNEYENATVDMTQKIKTLEVVEHAYTYSPITSSIVLYDNTETAIDMEATVVFDSAPIVVSSLTVTGSLKILASNENCAVVSGVGTLTGIPYTHTTNVISRADEKNVNGQSISVSDATMVNILNSNAVADRLYAYYSAKREMQIPIVLSGERCGMKYFCTTPFGEKRTAFISEMSITASAIAKADCKMVSGFDFPETSGELTHVVLLTGSGVFHTPNEVFSSNTARLRVVLIGGGQGGQGGQNGEDGKVGIVKGVENLAKPGANGKNGAPGRIRVLQINPDSIAAEYSYSCGEGGYGSSYYPYIRPELVSDGELGGPTLFGEYSSEQGAIPDVGFIDPLTGNVYGGPAPDFSNTMKSGRGGGCVALVSDDYVTNVAKKPESGVVVFDEVSAANYGYKAGEIVEFSGGDGAKFKDGFGYLTFESTGGGGGGPAYYSSKYHNGTASVIDGMTIVAGNGGDGSTPPPPPSPFVFSKTAYGQGGIGAQGGAGGGSSGYLFHHPNGYTIVDGTPGDGGRSHYGGKGAPGCILVYY